jgi:adenylosuccinate synthase
MLEGTQGSGLSLIHGTWPYVTSQETNTAQLYADCGLSLEKHHHTILVARAHPIRVAGTSGPLANETTWEELGIKPEYTTVTNKVRRVGMWDEGQVMRAISMNRPCQLAFMFLDYLFPECSQAIDWDALSQRARDFLKELAHRLDTDITYVGTGPDTVVDLTWDL